MAGAIDRLERALERASEISLGLTDSVARVETQIASLTEALTRITDQITRNTDTIRELERRLDMIEQAEAKRRGAQAAAATAAGGLAGAIVQAVWAALGGGGH